MNILSMASFFTAIVSAGVSIRIAKISRRNHANQIALAFCICISFFGLIQSFFYMAPTIEQAWLLHKIGSIAWIALPTLALQHTFFVNDKKSKYVWVRYRALVSFSPLFIIGYVWITDSSPIAEKLIQSPYGLGWCYSNSLNNPLFWIFVTYSLIYTGAWLVYILNISSKSKSKIITRESRIVASFDFSILILCLVFDFWLPLIRPGVSPIAIILLLGISIRFYLVLFRSGMYSIMNFVTPQIILETITDPMIVLDIKGRVVSYNKATCQWLRVQQSELLGSEFSEIIKGMNKNVEIPDLDSTKNFQEVVWTGENEDKRIMALVITDVKNDKYGNIAKILFFRDITSEKKMEEKLRSRKDSYKAQALTDSLTNIPNRRVFFEHFHACVDLYKKKNEDFAVISMDLNNFKFVNDTYGHAIGDELLVEIGRRLMECVKPNILLARMGGDEFAMLVKNVQDNDEIIELADEVNRRLLEELIIKDIICPVTISVGYSRFSESKDESEVFQIADRKMFENKRKSKMKVENKPHFRY